MNTNDTDIHKMSPSENLDIIIEAGAWPIEVEVWSERAFVATMSHLGLEFGDFEVTILFTDDSAILELNKNFRDQNKATDVLSWPNQEFPRQNGEVPTLPKRATGPFLTTLGDIAMGFGTCQRDAGARPFDAHITHLLVHGLLHLLGYDHITDEDAMIMEPLEVEILNKLDIDNPYLSQ